MLTLILPSFQNYEIYQAGAKLPLPTISKSSALTKILLSKGCIAQWPPMKTPRWRIDRVADLLSNYLK